HDVTLCACAPAAPPSVEPITRAWHPSMPCSYPDSNPGGFANSYTTSNPNPVPAPMATSAAGTARTRGSTGTMPATGCTTGNGYWVPKWDPIITGFIKIEIQIGYNPPCGKWQDVTQEILKLGIAGRNLNPGLVITSATQFPNEPPLPGLQIAPSACADPNPDAIIRLERVRDNPSTSSA